MKWILRIYILRGKARCMFSSSSTCSTRVSDCQWTESTCCFPETALPDTSAQQDTLRDLPTQMTASPHTSSIWPLLPASLHWSTLSFLYPSQVLIPIDINRTVLWKHCTKLLYRCEIYIQKFQSVLLFPELCACANAHCKTVLKWLF